MKWIGVCLVVCIAVLNGACSQPDNILPQSIYYLIGSDEQAQVWRLGIDGLMTNQITQEDAGVREFAVSPIDGNLAYVTENKLYLVDRSGQTRKLIADNIQQSLEAEHYGPVGPLWKP